MCYSNKQRKERETTSRQVVLRFAIVSEFPTDSVHSRRRDFWFRVSCHALSTAKPKVEFLAASQPTSTDGIAWSVRVSVCLLVTFVSSAKTAEVIEMLTCMGPMNHVLHGGEIPTGREGAILGSCLAHWKALGVSAAVYAAKRIIQSSTMAWHAMRSIGKILRLLNVFTLG